MSEQILAVSANGRPLCPIACPSSQGLEDIIGGRRRRRERERERESCVKVEVDVLGSHP